ncbi:hypothetical protein JCM10213_001787 [Rhodosporidiobolus nylandii]
MEPTLEETAAALQRICNRALDKLPFKDYPEYHSKIRGELFWPREPGGLSPVAVHLACSALNRAWLDTLIKRWKARAKLGLRYDDVKASFSHEALEPWAIKTPWTKNFSKFESCATAEDGEESVDRPAALSLAFAVKRVARCLLEKGKLVRHHEFFKAQDEFYVELAKTEAWETASLEHKFAFFKEALRLAEDFKMRGISKKNGTFKAADLKDWRVKDFELRLTERFPQSRIYPEQTKYDGDPAYYHHESPHGLRRTRSLSLEPPQPKDEEAPFHHLTRTAHSLGHPRIGHRSAAIYFPQHGSAAKELWEGAQRSFV